MGNCNLTIQSVCVALALVFPAGSAVAKTYVVSAGDTLWKISRNHGCDVQTLKAQNQLTDFRIQVGLELDIPPCEAEEAAADTLEVRSERTQPDEAKATVSQEEILYTIGVGDTLGAIAARYGTSVADIQQRNELHGSVIVAGKSLRVLPGGSFAETEIDFQSVLEKNALREFPVEQVIDLPKSPQKSKSVQSTARTHSPEPEAVTIAPQRIVERDIPNQRGMLPPPIKAAPPQREEPSVNRHNQSIGTPRSGRLLRAARLAAHKEYYIRRPHRSYGTTDTVKQLQRVILNVKKRFPKVHRLAVGDISAKKGGKIAQHASHQSGRDVDVGFFFRSKPKGYPANFVELTKSNINFKATWALITEFTDLADRDTGVEMIFLSYSTQKMIYKMARKRGVAKSELTRIFQYPAGRTKRQGIIRHEPGHRAHMHVRFKCPPTSVCDD